MSGSCLFCGQSLLKETGDYFDTRFGHPDLYTISQCDFCGLEQTLPRPDVETLQRLYETYYNFGGEKNTIYTRLREKFLLSPLYTFWLMLDGDISFHAVKGTGRLLDVGCNEGRGLKRYQQNGFNAEGLELNSLAAKEARSAGFVVHTCAVEDLYPDEPYDIVVLSNVLEHSLDPSGMLQAIHRILRPGGQVWISCPNNKSFARSLFGRYWVNWHVPFHLIHFSSASLEKLLMKTGFQIQSKTQITPALWITQSFICRLTSRRGQPTVKLRSTIWVAPIMLGIRFLLFPFLFLANKVGRGDCLLFRALNQPMHSEKL